MRLNTDAITLAKIRLTALAAVSHTNYCDGNGKILFPEAEDFGIDIPKERFRVEWLRIILRAEALITHCARLNKWRREFTRAAGDCVCESCGLSYFQHPADVADEPDVMTGSGLVILCDRSRVKL